MFTLARIAGHSSIATTQRYVHPQSEAVELAFRKLVTQGGHSTNSRSLDPAQTLEVTLEGEVKWPTTRQSETFTGVQANQIVTIKEGAGVSNRTLRALEQRATQGRN